MHANRHKLQGAQSLGFERFSSSAEFPAVSVCPLVGQHLSKNRESYVLASMLRYG
jgi:hypothetical protein